MNNSYLTPAINHYSTSYDYSYEYSSPTTPTYFNSSLLQPSAAPCPVHSPYDFYASLSMNLSPYSQNYYQPQVYPTPPPVQQQPIILPGADRTPLRRHKCFKKNELQILHQAYIRDSHPSTDVIQQLANQLNASIDKVRQWFKNRRHSDKQKKREIPIVTIH